MNASSIFVRGAALAVCMLAAYNAQAASTETQPPTAPAALSASPVSTSQISLSWLTAEDNVGVDAYLIERCEGASCSRFLQVGAVSLTSIVDSGLAAGVAYRYRVRARDAANNLSLYSPIASATTITGAGVAGSTTYQYDSLGRLEQVTVVPK